jgi:hypothetical protein
VAHRYFLVEVDEGAEPDPRVVDIFVSVVNSEFYGPVHMREVVLDGITFDEAEMATK